MKNLEKYITENRDAFNSLEPSADHFLRFEKKLRSKGRPKVIRLIAPALKVAAMFILVALSSLWVMDNMFPGKKLNGGITLSEVSPEYKEVEIYYTSLINEKYAQIKSFDLNSEEGQKDILMNEIEEMNAIYKSLSQELKSDPNNERIINAMIQYYQMKAEVMNQIIEKLKEFEISTNLNSNKNEATKI